MYDFIATRNGALLVNLVPARNSDGKIGMYDTKNDMFYSAGFIAGPFNITYVDYINIWGTQALDTQGNIVDLP